jgi:hypothetical protein
MLEFLGLFARLAELLGYIAQLGKLANSSKTQLAATAHLFLKLHIWFFCRVSIIVW